MQLATLVLEAKTDGLKRAERDLDKLRTTGATAERGLKGSLGGVENSFKKTGVSAKTTGTAIDKIGKSSEGASQKIKVTATESMKYDTAVRQVEKSVKAGTATQMQSNRVLGAASRSYMSVADSARAASNSTASVASVSAGAASSINFLAIAAKAFVAIQVAKTVFNIAASMAQASDAAVMLTGRVEALTGSAQRGQQALADAFNISKEIGIAIKGIGDMTGRFTLATQQIGYTQSQVSTLTETILRLGVIGGASTQELQSGAIQLGQGLASGVLQGEELRSVLENIPLVARAIADELGVGVGALRQMAADGEVTADIVGRALLNAAADARKEFEGLPLTVERASGQMAAAWDEFTVAIDNSIGASQALAKSLLTVADMIGQVTSSLKSIDDSPLGNMPNEVKELNEEIGKTQSQIDALKTSSGAIPVASQGAYNALNERLAEQKDLLQGIIEARRVLGESAGTEAFKQSRGYEKTQYNIINSIKEQAAEEERILSLSEDQLFIEKSIADFKKSALKDNPNASKNALSAMDAEAQRLAEMHLAKEKSLRSEAVSIKSVNKAARDQLREQERITREIERQDNAYRSLLQNAVYDKAPWLALESEATELQNALARVGSELDAFEKRQIEISINEAQFNASIERSLQGVSEAVADDYRDFINGIGEYSNEAIAADAREMQEALRKSAEETFDQWRDFGKSAFEDIFLSGEDGVKNLSESLMRMFAQSGIDNIANGFASLATSTVSDGINSEEIEKSVAQGSFDGIQSGIAGLLQSAGMNSGNASMAATGIQGAAQAYSIGAASGSPLMGGLGGAMSGASTGLSMGGPVGAIAGAVIGGVLGAIGGGGGPNRKDQLADFRSQSTQKLDESRGALESFIDTMQGSYVGAVTQSLRDAEDQTNQFIKLIMDATGDVNGPEMQRVWAAQNEFRNRQFNIIQDSIDGVVGALAQGMGMSSPMRDAGDSVRNFSQSLQEYMNDVAYANELVGQQSKTESQLNRIREAGVASLEAMVTGFEGMTQSESAMQRITGAANAMEKALIDLGHSAEDAAARSAAASQTAQSDYIDSFTTGLQRQINELSGFDYVNDFMDLSDALKSMSREAEFLGIGADKVAEIIRLRSSEIVAGANLSSDALQDVIMQFPDLAGAIGDLDAVIVTSISNLRESAQDAEFALVDAVNRQIEASRAQADADRESLQSPLGSARDSVNLYSNIADALERAYTDRRVLDAMGQRNQLSGATGFLQSAVRAGGTTDLDGLEKALSVVSDPSTALFESFAQYQQSFNVNTNLIDKLKSVTDDQLTVEEQILGSIERQLEAIQSASEAEIAELETTRDLHLDALREQTDALFGIDSNILTLSDAIKNIQGVTASISSQRPTTSQDYIRGLYNDILNRQADQSGLEFWTGRLNSGMSRDAVLQAFQNSEEAQSIPAFADGGAHTGGWRMVGERGPELELTGASRIYSNSETKKMFDTKSIIDELREMNSRIRDLQKNSKTDTRILNDWNISGLPKERTA